MPKKKAVDPDVPKRPRGRPRKNPVTPPPPAAEPRETTLAVATKAVPGQFDIPGKPRPTADLIKPKAKAKAKAEDSKTDRIDALVANINSKMKANVIRRADKSSSSYLLRRPTGITSIDVGIGGGFPASAPSVLVGPDGVGKDYVLWRTAAETQRIYGDDFNMAVYLTEFRPDKKFMRDICGLKVPMTDGELVELDESRARIGLPPITDEERARYTEKVGNIYFVYGVTAEEGFDILIDFVATNSCQIVAVNSIGFLQTEAKENTDTYKEFAQRSSEAMLITKMMPDLAMTLNRGDGDSENETTILLIDQVRAKEGAVARGRPLADKEKYRPAAGAWSLKHGKAVELTLHNGARQIDEATKTAWGREKNWEVTKGKLGCHEGARGTFIYHFEFGADLIGDLYSTCCSTGVIDGSSSWIEYDHPTFGFRAHGKEQVRKAMIESPELVDHLREMCFRKAQIVCRHH